MKQPTRTLTIAAATLAAGALVTCPQVRAQQAFGAGNIVVERVGGTSTYGAGAAALGSSATAVFVDEFSRTISGQAAPVQTISLQASATQPTPSSTSPNTTQLNLVASGSATSEGFLNLSADGTRLNLAGYNAIVGTASVSGTASTANQRVIGVINASGVVDTTTYSTTAHSANNIRSVVSANGTSNFYSAGAGTNGGTNLFPSVGSSTSTNLGPATNTRINEIFTVGGTQSLFYSTGSGTTGIYAYSGLPTATGATSTLLVADASPYGFSISADGKTIYVADDGTGKGITKYTSTTGAAGSFTAAATFVMAATRGLTVDYSGVNPVLYATNGTTLYSITDDGVNADFSSQTALTLATAPSNTAFRGVDFAPTAVPEPATVLGGLLLVGAFGWNQRRRLGGFAGWLRLARGA